MINCRHFFMFAILPVLWLGTAGLTSFQLLASISSGITQADTIQPVRAPHGMVVSASIHASTVGSDVLAAGGNAVDAAIATGFALAVTHPAAGNIGGGGFMVIRFPDGTTTAIDFRERPRWPLILICGLTILVSIHELSTIIAIWRLVCLGLWLDSGKHIISMGAEAGKD